jgi:hypothetical protein
MQVFKAYCDKKSLDPKSVKFLFDGHRLKAEDTPEAVSGLHTAHRVLSQHVQGCTRPLLKLAAGVAEASRVFLAWPYI